jgi:hypothetical protein
MYEADYIVEKENIELFYLFLKTCADNITCL